MDSVTGSNSVYQVQGPFHGAHAIYDYLDDKLVSKERLTFNQIRDLALNVAVTESLGVRFGAGGTPWKFVENYFHDAVNRIGKTSARVSALELLDSWDGKFVGGAEDFWVNGTEKAEGWVLSTNWISEALKAVCFDELAFPT
jgi:penicillin amidase